MLVNVSIYTSKRPDAYNFKSGENSFVTFLVSAIIIGLHNK